MAFKINPNANLKIIVKGLSIYYFNEANKQREFLFLRHLTSHILNIKITKRGGEGMQDVAKVVHEFKLDKDQDLFIEAETALFDKPTQGTITKEFTFETDENFGSADLLQNSEDPRTYDIRWVVGFHKQIENFPASADGVYQRYAKRNLTFLSLPPNSVIYTNSVSEFEYDEWERSVDNTHRKLISEKSRRIGNAVGADVQCELGSEIKFKIGGQIGFEIILPVAEGVSYEIEFDNSCSEAMTNDCIIRSDFQHNFDLFNFDPYRELITVPPSPFALDDEGSPIPVGISPNVSSPTVEANRSRADPPACSPTGTNPSSGNISLLDWRKKLIF